jgi:hypothetical protein
MGGRDGPSATPAAAASGLGIAAGSALSAANNFDGAYAGKRVLTKGAA